MIGKVANIIVRCGFVPRRHIFVDLRPTGLTAEFPARMVTHGRHIDCGSSDFFVECHKSHGQKSTLTAAGCIQIFLIPFRKRCQIIDYAAEPGDHAVIKIGFGLFDAFKLIGHTDLFLIVAKCSFHGGNTYAWRILVDMQKYSDLPVVFGREQHGVSGAGPGSRNCDLRFARFPFFGAEQRSIDLFAVGHIYGDQKWIVINIFFACQRCNSYLGISGTADGFLPELHKVSWFRIRRGDFIHIKPRRSTGLVAQLEFIAVGIGCFGHISVNDPRFGHRCIKFDGVAFGKIDSFIFERFAQRIGESDRDFARSKQRFAIHNFKSERCVDRGLVKRLPGSSQTCSYSRCFDCGFDCRLDRRLGRSFVPGLGGSFYFLSFTCSCTVTLQQFCCLFTPQIKFFAGLVKDFQIGDDFTGNFKQSITPLTVGTAQFIRREFTEQIAVFDIFQTVAVRFEPYGRLRSGNGGINQQPFAGKVGAALTIMFSQRGHCLDGLVVALRRIHCVIQEPVAAEPDLIQAHKQADTGQRFFGQHIQTRIPQTGIVPDLFARFLHFPHPVDVFNKSFHLRTPAVDNFIQSVIFAESYIAGGSHRADIRIEFFDFGQYFHGRKEFFVVDFVKCIKVTFFHQIMFTQIRYDGSEIVQHHLPCPGRVALTFSY